MPLIMCNIYLAAKSSELLQDVFFCKLCNFFNYNCFQSLILCLYACCSGNMLAPVSLRTDVPAGLFCCNRCPVPQHFHEAAYQADERQDLLTAINLFLDCSVVLPPSDVGGDELLHSVARFQREMLRKREEESGKLQEKQSSVQLDEGPCSSAAA